MPGAARRRFIVPFDPELIGSYGVLMLSLAAAFGFAAALVVFSQ
jgi:hypothetical protein